MTASAAHYDWFQGHALREGYFLALIENVTPAEMLERLGAEPGETHVGFSAFTDAHDEIEDEILYGDADFAGLTEVAGRNGPWTLMVGINGTAGVDDRLMSTASAGTQIVAHYTDINALTYFHWWKDGEQRTMFEHPATRSGTTPDALVEAMHRVGIDTVDGTFSVTANLALAEEVTGIRITEDLLDNAVYTSSLIELPSEDWNSIVIDITDAHGERTHKELTREQAEHAWNQARAKDNQPIPLDAIARDEPGAS